MATRDFDAVLAEKAGVRPTFRVGGQEFTVKARLPIKKYRELIDFMTSDEGDEGSKTEQFFRTVLIPADRDRFLALYNNEDDEDETSIVDQSQVDEITTWLLEHITGKQLRKSDSSTSGASETSQPQNVVSLNSRTQAG